MSVVTHGIKWPLLLASYFGIGKEGLLAKAIDSPQAAVAVDVAARKRDPPCPGTGWFPDWSMS